MKKTSSRISFAKLFKKYRLRAEIETLSEFGDLLAQEGIVYESSLFTRWQNGTRVPSDRRILLTIVNIFIKRGAIRLISEVNHFFEAANQGYLTDQEKINLPKFLEKIINQNTIQDISSLLKTYRIQKNITLSEMMLALNVSDYDFIDKIERGDSTNIDKNFIEKYCNVLGLQKQEINNILLLCNYMPTKQEIKSVQETMAPVLESYQYSAVLYDFCWRVIYINNKHSKILDMKKEEMSNIHKENPTAIEILFDPAFQMNKILMGNDRVIWHENLLRFIVHFRSLQRSIIKDEWYINLINKMIKNHLFRKIWRQSEIMYQGMRLTYNIYVVPLYDDPRFEIEYYSPADITTIHYCQRIHKFESS